ncbi:MAG: aminoglycoside phosphotransferase family protein, partial [Hungatella sp.]|nr:aminoglycoside phosphotransferase family protein [Hungatella sp.]
MDQVKGLGEYIKWKKYRERLGLTKEVTEEYRMLAQGEYNRNYLFLHPVTGKKLILRVNFGSQMHLEDQIGYEFRALELLKDSGRTPRPLYVDGTKEKIPYGIMVMEYLPGHALDYEKELLCAADCLADIHSIDLGNDPPLVAPDNPLKAILEECEEMFRTYEESALGDEGKKRKIRRMLDRGWGRADSLSKPAYRCCINTELNSTNFLINGQGKGDYLIDWEKPVYGDPAQDLGHFLAPTTTFWKTDVILESEQMERF